MRLVWNQNILLHAVAIGIVAMGLATGDMLNATNDRGEVFLDLAGQLAGSYPVYYIEGNHEQIAGWKARESRSPWYEAYLSSLKKAGVIVLDNSKTLVTRGSAALSLYGMKVPLPYYKGKDIAGYAGEVPFSRASIEKILKNPDRREFNILLSHNPSYFSAYSQWGADLVLAGHTHGGIVRVPFKGGLISPEGELFPQYDAGRFTLNGTTMIINRGLGNYTINLRIFNRPELTLIHLRPGNATPHS